MCRRVISSLCSAAEEMLDRVDAAANSSVSSGELAIVAELFVTEDREFQATGARDLNALDWKLFFYLLITPKQPNRHAHIQKKR